MQTQIRKIGNSKGVIITPTIKNKQQLRAGWFDNYDPEKDIDIWQGFVELPSEQEDWER